MKKILSEKNIAAILFLIVFIAFSFAHEDSKKRYTKYSVSFPTISANNVAIPFVNNLEKTALEGASSNSINQK